MLKDSPNHEIEIHDSALSSHSWTSCKTIIEPTGATQILHKPPKYKHSTNSKHSISGFGDSIFLTQTDTTVGFVSQNSCRLTQVKERPPNKHYIRAVNSLRTLTHFTRIPSSHKKRVRRARRTTFIMPSGDSFRLIRERGHLLLINRLTWAYTTSANLSGEPYDEAFAKEAADIVITPLQTKRNASAIYRLGKNRLKRIR